MQQPSPRRQADAVLFLFDGRPRLGDDAEKLQGLLPVVRVVLRHQVGQPIKAQALGFDLIKQSPQFLGQPGGLIHRRHLLGGSLLMPGQDCPGQQQLPGQGGKRLRQIGFARTGDPVLLLGQQQLFRIQVAQRDQARHQQGLPGGGPQKGLLDRAAAPAGG